MSFVATSSEFSLAEAVGTALFMARAGQSGACLWCGARTLELAETEDRALTVVCHTCGSELTEESTIAYKVEVA